MSAARVSELGRRGPGPVAGFPHSVLGAKCAGPGRGACAAEWGCPSRRHPLDKTASTWLTRLIGRAWARATCERRD